MKTEDWLKEADAIIIECEEEYINPHTLVSVSSYNTKTKEHLINVRKSMTLQEAFKINKRQIAKGDKLIAYLNSRIGKKEFD